MGLAVAKALAERGSWNLHLLDINEERGIQAAKELPNATFHKTDATQYCSLATTFKGLHHQRRSTRLRLRQCGRDREEELLCKTSRRLGAASRAGSAECRCGSERRDRGKLSCSALFPPVARKGPRNQLGNDRQLWWSLSILLLAFNVSLTDNIARRIIYFF